MRFRPIKRMVDGKVFLFNGHFQVWLNPSWSWDCWWLFSLIKMNDGFRSITARFGRVVIGIIWYSI